ncbi:MAG: hypothetical protein IJM25_00700 [Eubacterium sp.]|nr:hypothetical protein [Eubacterium sp.]
MEQTNSCKTVGKWYYFGADGIMRAGSLKILTKTYSFSSSGVCQNP